MAVGPCIFLVFKPNPNAYVGCVCGEVGPVYERHRFHELSKQWNRSVRWLELPVNEEHRGGNVDAQPTV